MRAGSCFDDAKRQQKLHIAREKYGAGSPAKPVPF
jgi:hypothetical protein